MKGYSQRLKSQEDPRIQKLANGLISMALYGKAPINEVPVRLPSWALDLQISRQ